MLNTRCKNFFNTILLIFIKRNITIFFFAIVGLWNSSLPISDAQQGTQYHHQRNYEQALRWYTKALEQSPQNGTILYNLSLVFNELGNFEASQKLLEQIANLYPQNKHVDGKLVLHYLRNKDWEKAAPLLSIKDYWWYNEIIKNKRVLIQHDGGFGDAIQFMRYAKRLHNAGAQVIVETPSALVPLLSNCPFIDRLVELGNSYVSTDKKYIVSTPRLAFIMRNTLEKPTTDVPYLIADPALIAYWQKQLACDKNIKIGLCWQASIMHDQTGSVIPNPRSIPLSHFAPLASIPGISFYSLQKINGTDQLTMLPKSFVVKTFGSDFDEVHGRFMDTAAVMKNLDLVITIDSSVAHLAGALGIPVWVILPTASDFRWFADRSDSPWYPTMRLFRQKKQDNWHAVMQKIVQELQNNF